VRPHAVLSAQGTRALRARIGGGWHFDRDAGFWASAAGVTSQGRDYRFPELAVDGSDGRSVRADDQLATTAAVRAWLGDFTLQASYNMRRKDIPTGSFESILGHPYSMYRDTRAFAELRYEPVFWNDMHVYARAFWDHYEYAARLPYLDEDDPDEGDDGVDLLRDNWNGHWIGAEVRVAWPIWPWLRLMAGGEARLHLKGEMRGQNEQQRYLDLDEEPQIYAGYGNVDLTPFEWLTLSVGTRFDVHSETGNAFSPRAALILQPYSSATLKVIGGQAYRAPSVYERRYHDNRATQKPAGPLKPENVYTIEAEYTQRFLAEWAVVGSVFYNEIVNQIDLSPDEADQGLLVYRNLCPPGSNTPETEAPCLETENHRVRTLGAEIEVRRELREGILIAASYAFQRTRRGSLGGGENISNSPAHLVSFKGALPIVPGIAHVATRLRYEPPRLDRDLGRGDTILLWDVTLTGGFGDSLVEWALGVRNLLDWRYGHPVSDDHVQRLVPQAGRTFFLSLKLQY
jgi:outer membrane receptor protein involved in Fe transport